MMKLNIRKTLVNPDFFSSLLFYIRTALDYLQLRLIEKPQGHTVQKIMFKMTSECRTYA